MDASVLDAKLEVLRAALTRLGSVAIAFSGGLDSTLLLRIAHDALGDRVLAVTAVSETYPPDELDSARALAAEMGVSLVVIETNELKTDGFRFNPPDRCYHCKSELFARVRAIAAKRGIEHVADGTNADDERDYRPGRRAEAEFRVLAPLRDAGMTKAEIRELSRRLGLRTWDKPACACLASRFPYGTEITPERLRQVGRAEQVLHELGFHECRVRYHGDTARIEVPQVRIADLAARATADRIVDEFKRLGFRYVALDLQGYRMGSLNEALAGKEVER